MLREGDLCALGLRSCVGSDLIGHVEMQWENKKGAKLVRTEFHSGSKQILSCISPLPAAIGHHLKTLTINFTITNLPYSSNMSNGSALFSSTETFLHYLVRTLSQQPARDWSHMNPLSNTCFHFPSPSPSTAWTRVPEWLLQLQLQIGFPQVSSFLSLCKEWTLHIVTILIPPPPSGSHLHYDFSKGSTLLSFQAQEEWNSHWCGCHLCLLPWPCTSWNGHQRAVHRAEKSNSGNHPAGELLTGQGQSLCQWWVFSVVDYGMS